MSNRVGAECPSVKEQALAPCGALAAPSLTFTLFGQLPGGKNSVKTTRTGRRYPSKRFELWRDQAMFQLPKRNPGFKGPVSMEVSYTKGDLRRRDMPGMLDAICHVLEQSGIVDDDSQVVGLTWMPFPLDRKNPCCIVTITELP